MRTFLARSSALVFLVSALSPAFAQDAAPPAAAPAAAPEAERSGVEEIIVTAQKREQNLNEVGMSISAMTGDQLAELGVTDASQLDKVVTGFNYSVTYYGTPILTIRGVGFQDTALASGPTVSVYLDEMPLQFAVMTQGAGLDLARVEALKGPQGTLFGQNATGGAINYIANKPSQEFEAGFDVSYGRFNTADITAFVSGPLTDTLSARFAGRVLNSGPWQKSYTANSALPPDYYWTENGRSYRRDTEHGDQEFYNMRGSLLFEPTDSLSALFTMSAFLDRSDSQMPQLFGFGPLNQVNKLRPLIAGNADILEGPLMSPYPFAPHNNRAADWGPCVNTSGGTPSNLTGGVDSAGEAVNLSNRLYDNCVPAEKDNTFYSPSLRVDYNLTDDITLTSLTSYGKFDREMALESDGMIYQDYESYQQGYLKAFSQELRVAGSLGGEGAWVVGANYENTSTWDSFMQTYGISTAVPTVVLTATPLGPTNPNSRQTTDTYAMFANVEYPVFDWMTLQGGVRYTNQHRDYRGCGSDGGDGSWADISVEIQRILQLFLLGIPLGSTVGLDAGPGNCASTGPASNLFFPEPDGFTGKLNEDNVSWRVGANFTPTEELLVYANISQGWKSGSFPTVASAAFTQLFPAKQEGLLAYEAGLKWGLLDDTLQLNAAAFYYDYEDKQVLGAVADIIFGSLPALVNVPKSHVVGFELSAAWQPIEGLRIAPSVSYAKSEIDGTFRSFDPFYNTAANGSTKDFSGEPFPNAPAWQANVDAQYEFALSGEWRAFVGANMNYQDSTKGFFYDRCNEGPSVTCTTDYLNFALTDLELPTATGSSDLVINSRALLDVRAGIEQGAWRVWLYGRNVTDKHYWNQAQHVNDVLLRFTGQPATYGITASYRFGD